MDPTRDFLQRVETLTADRSAVEKLGALRCLTDILVRTGHSRVAKASTEEAGELFPGAITVALVLWGVSGALGLRVGVPMWAWPLLGLGLVLLLGLVVTRTPFTGQTVGAGFVVLWALIGAVLLVLDPSQLLWTYAVPGAGAILLALGSNRLHLRQARDAALALTGVARSAPFVAPVVLLVILLPALTADVWQLASDITAQNVIGAAMVSIGVLLVFVNRQLGSELEPALTSRCRALGAGNRAELTRDALIANVDEDHANSIPEISDEVLDDAWPRTPEEYAPYLAAVERRALRRSLFGRLVITTASIGILLTSYIYVLLAMTVPRDTVGDWTESSIDTWMVGALGLEVTVPLGPYLAMSAVLGVFATAIFLAFALTEERFGSELTAALLREPIDQFLVLAVPLIGLLEWVSVYDGPLAVAGRARAAAARGSDSR